MGQGASQHKRTDNTTAGSYRLACAWPRQWALKPQRCHGGKERAGNLGKQPDYSSSMTVVLPQALSSLHAEQSLSLPTKADLYRLQSWEQLSRLQQQ